VRPDPGPASRSDVRAGWSTQEGIGAAQEWIPPNSREIEEHSRAVSKRRRVDVPQQYVPTRELRVRAPDKATLTSRTMATITAAARTVYLYDASLDDVDAHAKEQLDEAAREHFAAPGTIADAVMVVAPRQRRDLR
jgi:hypothetical protein